MSVGETDGNQQNKKTKRFECTHLPRITKLSVPIFILQLYTHTHTHTHTHTRKKEKKKAEVGEEIGDLEK
jgi:hypothetical protein